MLGSAVRTVREPPLPSKIVGDTFGWFGSDWACFGNLKQASCAVGSGLNEKRPCLRGGRAFANRFEEVAINPARIIHFAVRNSPVLGRLSRR